MQQLQPAAANEKRPANLDQAALRAVIAVADVAAMPLVPPSPPPQQLSFMHVRSAILLAGEGEGGEGRTGQGGETTARASRHCSTCKQLPSSSHKSMRPSPSMATPKASLMSPGQMVRTCWPSLQRNT